MALKDWWNSLSGGEKFLVGGLAVLAGGAALGALATSGGTRRRSDDDCSNLNGASWLREEDRQDRSLRRSYGSSRVLRQPTIATSDGRYMRPDNLVRFRGRYHVVERKDVAALRLEHLLQTAEYADAVGGTAEVRVSCDTDVSERTAAIADALGIDVRRSRC